MRLFTACIVYVPATVLFFSCTDRQGETVLEAYPDGKPKIVTMFTYDNEQKTAYRQVHYYPSGVIEKEGGLKDGKRHGKWTSWYKNGIKWSEGEFIDGKSRGTFRSYTKEGNLYMESVYNNGIPNGTWKFYDSKQQVIKEMVYVDGKVEQVKDLKEGAPFK